MRSCEVLIHLPVFNRKGMFQNTLQQLRQTVFPPGLKPAEVILLVNSDGPSPFNLSSLLDQKSFPMLTAPAERHLGCDRNILKGFRYAVHNFSFKYLINIEDDSQVHPHWLQALWELKWQAVGKAWTVYNSPKHKAYMMRSGANFQILSKKTVGGFGLMMARHTIQELLNYIHRKGVGKGWDWRLCEMATGAFISTSPSYLQHVGRIGVHTEAGDPHWDHAQDFIGDQK
jgi:hypothetical protein